MSAKGVRAPVFEISCDADRCHAKIREEIWFEEAGLRAVARERGWQTRPARGKGSRSDPDYCPDHKQPTTSGSNRDGVDG